MDDIFFFISPESSVDITMYITLRKYVKPNQDGMYVYIIGGFLGSGKTTLLMRLASMYTKRGQKTALLVNESGEIGVDGATLKAEGYDAIELPNGCICCSLSGTLQSALQNIENDIDPDVIIVEPPASLSPTRSANLSTSPGSTPKRRSS